MFAQTFYKTLHVCYYFCASESRIKTPKPMFMLNGMA